MSTTDPGPEIVTLVQLLDRRQAHSGKILHAVGSIAGVQLKRLEEIFCHGAHMTNLATLRNEFHVLTSIPFSHDKISLPLTFTDETAAGCDSAEVCA